MCVCPVVRPTIDPQPPPLYPLETWFLGSSGNFKKVLFCGKQNEMIFSTLDFLSEITRWKSRDDGDRNWLGMKDPSRTSRNNAQSFASLEWQPAKPTQGKYSSELITSDSSHLTKCVRLHCPQGLVVAIGAANFALWEVQANFLHRKGYNLMFILCLVIKAIGYLLCAVLVVS